MHVGITGHQKLDDSKAWDWVASEINNELDVIPTPLVGVSSLAIGADQLLARLVLERRGSLYAVLPYVGIEKSFSPEHLGTYKMLLKRATVEVLNTPGTDEDAYLAAGKRVADLSSVLVAVWNGEPARGRGGTADIVAYALKEGVPLVHLNPLTRTVSKLRPGKKDIQN